MVSYLKQEHGGVITPLYDYYFLLVVLQVVLFFVVFAADFGCFLVVLLGVLLDFAISFPFYLVALHVH